MENFSKVIANVSQRYSRSVVFSDFLEITICTLSSGEEEDRYFEIIERYKPEEIRKLKDAFASLIYEMDNGGFGLKDVLGEYFTFEITRGENGQYFTPESICDLMANVVGVEKTVFDPSCGSGRALLSAEKVRRKKKGDNKCSYFGADIDFRCASMTAINLCLNGLYGESVQMNSLSNEYFTGWRILKHPVHKYPFLRKIEKEDSFIAITSQERENRYIKTNIDVETIKIVSSEASQLELNF